jgi:indole-3-glycerol phosphate synthase
VQGTGNWSPPTGTLGRIIGEAAERVSKLRRDAPRLERTAADAGRPGLSLKDALRQTSVGIIAEVKRRSPSKGWIAEGLPAVALAHAYADGGAAAISVLTEPTHFDGSIEDLDAVVGDIDLPVLKKDFHIDPIQLAEARAHGATAVLLIVRALHPQQLQAMLDAAKQFQLETLVEVRDKDELKRAIDAGAEIIGINNRDLETLIIDPTTSVRLLPMIPSGLVAVVESGISTITDVARVAALGVDAVLVGSSLSSADDPEALVRQLASHPRKHRVR